MKQTEKNNFFVGARPKNVFLIVNKDDNSTFKKHRSRFKIQKPIRKFKDEAKVKIIVGFVGLKSKMCIKLIMMIIKLF